MWNKLLKFILECLFLFNFLRTHFLRLLFNQVFVFKKKFFQMLSWHFKAPDCLWENVAKNSLISKNTSFELYNVNPLYVEYHLYNNCKS